MTTTGPTFTGLGASRDAGGTTPLWSNPTNIYSDNAATASATTSNATSITDWLDCTTFGFALPASDIVDGITADVDRSANSATVPINAVDQTIQILVAGTPSGTNKADTGTKWPTAGGVKTYGGAADPWGLTLTGADVNATTFGLTIRATIRHIPDGAASIIANVDYVKLTITHHSAATGIGYVTSRGGWW